MTRIPLRLCKRAEFLSVRTGEKRRGSLFLLELKKRPLGMVPGPDDPPRIGFTVTRKNGNAVMRNRIRRRLREAVRTALADDLVVGTDYVIVARPEVLGVSFDHLIRELKRYIR
ncbi:MAG: ribonuclease P protein component [Candidatus Tokpelaia sp. JSC189]|nr:MAG: ribonuclease P protein component [Candidatus Tokpelaia sp. JSC189]